MNPMQLLKAKDQIGKFRERHPKFIPFLKSLSNKVMDGSVLEVKLTNPDGNSTTSNIKLTPEDLKILKDFFK